MSTLTSYTSGTRPTASGNTGLCIFRSDTNAIEVSDGTDWQTYNSDGTLGWSGTNNYSLNFDGTDDYLTAASIVTPTAQQGTISAWVKSTTSSFGPIFNISSNTALDTGYWMGLQFSGVDAGKLEFAHRPNNGDYILYTSSSTYNDGNWHHVAVTSNGLSYKLFIDGAEDTTATTSGSNPSNVVGGWIGDMVVKNSCNIGAQRRNADAASSTAYFNGNIDELAIWDSALSSSQISTIYNSGTPGNLLPLNSKAWWTMGDGVESGSGATIYDMSGNSNNMTIVNAIGGNNTTGADYQTDTP